MQDLKREEEDWSKRFRRTAEAFLQREREEKAARRRGGGGEKVRCGGSACDAWIGCGAVVVYFG